MAPSLWRKFFGKEKMDEIPTADELHRADMLLNLCKETIQKSNQRLSTKDSREDYLMNRQQCGLLVKNISDTLAFFQENARYGLKESSIPVLEELLQTFVDVEVLIKASCITTLQWPRAAIELGNMTETFSKLLYDIQWYTSLFRSFLSRFGFPPTLYQGHLCEQVASALLTAMKEDEESLKQRLRFVQVIPTEKELVIQLLNQLEASSSDLLFLNPRDLDLNGALIAHGGFGAVVKTNFLGSECAMKIINVGSNSTSVDFAFQKEMDAMKELGHHPHIVHLFCYSRTDEACYLIMEKMQMDLSKYLRCRKNNNDGLSVVEAVSLMLQIGEGMEYIHSKGAAHRDLKPENILVNLKNPSDDFLSSIRSVKISDFGLTKTKEASKTCSIHTKNTGTSMYMAPEVIKLGEDDPEKVPGLNPLKADVYSFAIMCSVILTGEKPYKVPFTREMKKQLKAGTLPRPDLPTECPLRLGTLIRKCWAEDHYERPLFPEICKELRYIKGLGLKGIIKAPIPLLIPRPRTALTSSILGKPLVDIRETYTLGRELGQGDTAVIYSCTHKETGEVFAVKSIAKWKLISLDDIEGVKREVISGDNIEGVKREVQIMHHLSGTPNVVELMDVFEDQDFVHLVMEYCWGGSLYNRIIAKGHYNKHVAADLCRVIVTVVQKCHSLGVLHLDLKPENFLFASTLQNAPLKLTNFSRSTFLNHGELLHRIVRSPSYVAPEVLKGSCGPEADIWTVGGILYFLLCGKHPFSAEAAQDTINAVWRGQINFKANPRPNISRGAKDLVMKMLNRDVRKRLTAQQVLSHPWMKEHGDASDEPLDDAVLMRLKKFWAANKMKKLALRMIAESLSEEEIVGLWLLFKSIDTDKSGTLTFEELKEWLIRRGTELVESDVKKLMDAVDMDGNGMLDPYEFISATMLMSEMETEDRLFSAFQHFDTDNNGYITTCEVQEALEARGWGADPVTIQEIMNKVDTNNDGRIDYIEFVAMMRKGNSGTDDSDKLFKHIVVPWMRPTRA